VGLQPPTVARDGLGGARLGKRILGAEAFHCQRQREVANHPASIKALGDWGFARALIASCFHRYALQPWDESDRSPGMSMGPWACTTKRTQDMVGNNPPRGTVLAPLPADAAAGNCSWRIFGFLVPEGSPMLFRLRYRRPEQPARKAALQLDGCPRSATHPDAVSDGKLVLPDG